MSYVVPSVLVYQQLATSGGVANVTPDLDGVIIGPCYNVLKYNSTSTDSLLATAGLNADGTQFTLTDPTRNHTVYLPGQKPGQIITESSVSVFLNNASIETLVTQAAPVPDSPNTASIPLAGMFTSGSATSGSAVITGVSHTDVAKFHPGDALTVSTYVHANVVSVDPTAGTITLDTVMTFSGSATLNRVGVSGTNSATATKRVEAGDTIVITYDGGPTTPFSTTIQSVVSSNGVVTEFVLSDMMPSDVLGLSGFNVSIRKKYNNQELLAVLGGTTNYDASTVSTTSSITLHPHPVLAYGGVVSADVYIQYSALRVDLSGTVIEIDTASSIVGQLGVISDENPLALGVELGLANTSGRLFAVAVPSNDLAGYLTALELIEGQRLYAIAALTQDIAVHAAVKVHVTSMSTPENASWRIAVLNGELPTTQDIGEWGEGNVNDNSGNNTITVVSGRYVLTASNATFLDDGVTPGDTVVITAGTGSPSPVGSLKVLSVISNQQVQVQATGTATAVSYYITRTLTKLQQAAHVASVCNGFSSNRVRYVPEDALVTVNGVTKHLPGYYLCAAIVGLISGLPVQQSLTNIGIAGVVGVVHGNFYFTKAQLGTMAAAGAFLVVQETQGAIPYVRHALTTDTSVFQYREDQQVKNWDYLSYYFHDIMKGFIGQYNVTDDTISTLRQTITAGAELLKSKKLPKIGAPLTSLTIASLAQDPNNKDQVVANLPFKMPNAMNYLNLYLIS